MELLTKSRLEYYKEQVLSVSLIHLPRPLDVFSSVFLLCLDGYLLSVSPLSFSGSPLSGGSTYQVSFYLGSPLKVACVFSLFKSVGAEASG